MVYKIQLLKSRPVKDPNTERLLETFVGVVKFGELERRYQIPHRVHATDKGYQRKPTVSRVNRLAKDLIAEIVDLPTAILLSLRDKNLSPQINPRGGYILTLPENGKRSFYVIDGQHRLEALKKAMNEYPDSDWFNFIIPAVIICGASEEAEMRHFHIVNSNAKSISTDLALDLLKKRAKQDGSLMDDLIKRGERWKIDAQDLTEKVSQLEMWRGKIRFPNEPKGRTLINSNGFVRSLKRALEQANFADYTRDKQAAIIDAYWLGIRKALPDCFFSPAEYNIQKAVGVSVFHYLLPTALFYARQFESLVDHPDTYFDIFEVTLGDLRGENQESGEAVGPDFWKVGREGASGTFSSNPGQRVLREKIRRELQENHREQLGWE